MSYLDERDEEEAAGAPAPAGKDIDLSAFKPSARPRDRSAVGEAVSAGRQRGFARPTSAAGQATPAEAKPPGNRPAKTEKAGAGERVIVSLANRPTPGQTGQIALSGDAQTLYDFARFASFNRLTRGEMLGEMMKLWAKEHGELPDDFRPRR